MKIADGTIITPLLVQNDDKALLGVDQFVRTTEETYSAQINYDKGKYNVTSKEMKDKDIMDLQAWLTAAQSNPKVAPKKMVFVSYASPEGETTDNDQLARDRANSGQEAATKIVTASGFEANGTFYSQSPKGKIGLVSKLLCARLTWKTKT